jgi:hypothetical protein
VLRGGRRHQLHRPGARKRCRSPAPSFVLHHVGRQPPLALRQRGPDGVGAGSPLVGAPGECRWG